jgi:hypothetical protein
MECASIIMHQTLDIAPADEATKPRRVRKQRCCFYVSRTKDAFITIREYYQCITFILGVLLVLVLLYYLHKFTLHLFQLRDNFILVLHKLDGVKDLTVQIADKVGVAVKQTAEQAAKAVKESAEHTINAAGNTVNTVTAASNSVSDAVHSIHL